ncbi:DUF2849 domain-containing protein [Pandoraea sputorum]|uniref:Sulfite reductase [ferredoxin] n=1 Tax=Pandoraea sputorum TaxID=93222 RepID=A0A239SFQ0_9BURK|nr:DUF2849 domain-containing protein [Pandoraea sputorum]AJC16805.1 nitrite reductase [Pandoraea sputorum]SNU84256.1 Sulfite reductase [ferredoxin] [Pandoraea sputorum]
MNAGNLISANRLKDGLVVWLDEQHNWVDDLTQAHVFDADSLDQAQAAAKASAAANLIVDPVPRPAEVSEGGPVPVDFREQLRSRGPSVREDLGKQAGDADTQAALAHAPALTVAPEHAGIYRYDPSEREYLKDRANEFGRQVARRLSGELSEDDFKVYRLMNGLYLQLHGYMLRVAIPYGTLSAVQLRQLAYVANRYDKGYGHFTTRQNLQFNWPTLTDSPDILSALADVDLHAIQTSGNCIRNVTTDQFAGAAKDEVVDPRVYAEILRQWSTDHPEFTYLPRKFKIAITGGQTDRAAVRFHDIGILARTNEQGEVGFQIYAGGGLGRTPIVGTLVREWLPEADLLRFVEAILRVYNALGRRDNIYKARIKILIKEMQPAKFIEMIEEEFARIAKTHRPLADNVIAAIGERFILPEFETLPVESTVFAQAYANDIDFKHWVDTCTHEHKAPGYISAVVSLKPASGIPGDASAQEMLVLADLADQYSFSELRVTHEQNLVLPHVKRDELHALWKQLKANGLATPNIGLISDAIACPGLDYCALANARSVPVAQRIALRFTEEQQRDIGPVTLNVSGCINACAHHHVAHIGILGVDKAGKENYQITLGGSADDNAAVGKILGPGVSYEAVPQVIENILGRYLKLRHEGERFIDTLGRVGAEEFKGALHVD